MKLIYKYTDKVKERLNEAIESAEECSMAMIMNQPERAEKLKSIAIEELAHAGVLIDIYSDDLNKLHNFTEGEELTWNRCKKDYFDTVETLKNTLI